MCSHPCIIDAYAMEPMSHELWFAIVDKMAQAFGFLETWEWEREEGIQEYVEQGLDLFREYYHHLWD